MENRLTAQALFKTRKVRLKELSDEIVIVEDFLARAVGTKRDALPANLRVDALERNGSKVLQPYCVLAAAVTVSCTPAPAVIATSLSKGTRRLKVC
jgi:hypothetical protein